MEEDYDQAYQVLVQEIKQAIQEQTQRRNELDRQQSMALRLAQARYYYYYNSDSTCCGSNSNSTGNPIGVLLSMRKAHKSQTLKAYTCAARYQLIALQQEIEAANAANTPTGKKRYGENTRSTTYCMDEIEDQRKRFHQILSDVSTIRITTVPQDDELLQRLERSLRVLEPSSSTSSKDNSRSARAA
jgi:hypothetical protein